MSLTDLTNTTWTFKSALNTYPGGTYTRKSYNINITTSEKILSFGQGDMPEDTFISISIGYNSGSEMNDIVFAAVSQSQYGNNYIVAYGHDTKSLPDSWIHAITVPFTITGGTDVTNSALIAWLEANADQVLPEINYIATSTDLTSVADAIRTKAGTSAQLVFPTGFVSAIRDIPSGGGGGSTLIEVSNFVGNVYYIDSADGVLKMQYRPMSSLSVPSGSMVVLHWNGPKPPDGVTLVNLSIVYSVSNGTKANYPATDFCIAS